MKVFKCWILTDYGWNVFTDSFDNEKQAYEYCESKTKYKGTSIVEELSVWQTLPKGNGQ